MKKNEEKKERKEKKLCMWGKREEHIYKYD